MSNCNCGFDAGIIMWGSLACLVQQIRQDIVPSSHKICKCICNRTVVSLHRWFVWLVLLDCILSRIGSRSSTALFMQPAILKDLVLLGSMSVSSYLPRFCADFTSSVEFYCFIVSWYEIVLVRCLVSCKIRVVDRSELWLCCLDKLLSTRCFLFLLYTLGYSLFLLYCERVCRDAHTSRKLARLGWSLPFRTVKNDCWIWNAKNYFGKSQVPSLLHGNLNLCELILSVK